MGEISPNFSNVAVLDAVVDLDVLTQPIESYDALQIPDTPASLMPDNPDAMPPVAEQQETKEQPKKSFEEIVAEVEAHFDGRIFTFKSHTGTAAQMAALCPMAQMAFKRGKEFAISFLEKFDGTPDDPKKPETEEKKNPNEPKQADAADESKSETSSDSDSSAIETKKDIPVARTIMAQVAIADVKNNDQASDRSAKSADRSESTSSDSSGSESKTKAGESYIAPVVADSPDMQPVVKPAKREQPALPDPVQQNQTQELTIEKSVEPIIAPDLVIAVIEDSNVTESKDVATIDQLDKQLDVIVPAAITIEPESKPEIQIAALEIIEPEEYEPESSSVFDIVTDLVQQELPALEPEHTTEMAIESPAVELSENVHDELVMQEATADENTASDYLYYDIAQQLGIGDTEHKQTVQIEPVEQREYEPTTTHPIAEMIVDVINNQPDDEQPAIKHQLTEIVRSIEILKRSQTAEECNDALEGLKENLAALFAQQGFDDPERMAVELLNDYHLKDIDIAMNQALKTARRRKPHTSRLASMTHLSIGRHVVSLLFANASNGLAFRSIFFVDRAV